MTDSELKTLCVNAMERPHDAGIGLYVVLRQVLTLDPEPPPPKSKGTELAQFASERFWTQSALAAAIDQAIADERQAYVKPASVHGSTYTAERIKDAREREDKQEETRT